MVNPHTFKILLCLLSLLDSLIWVVLFNFNMVHWFRSYLTDRKQKVIIQPSDAAQNLLLTGEL